MDEQTPSFYGVVIVGAGPVGLFLACELGLRGLSVLVLEREVSPLSPLKRKPFGVRGLTIPTIEALYRRELLSAIGAAVPREAGHFAGVGFDYRDVDTSKWSYRLPGPADTNSAGEMQCIESALAVRARALGVEIVRGAEVRSFGQSADAVTVETSDGLFRAQWLVGCDGGRSIVRKVGGFEFVGTEPDLTGYSTLVEIADPEKLRAERSVTPTGVYFLPQPGFLAMAEFDGGSFHRTEPITLEHVQSVLRRVSNTDVTLTALHAVTSWTDRAQQATTYKKGRVLLAGDAAHIHSPLGGQGLNLGLGDAMNLGWKLAATLRGEAPAGLLDTYTTERHPIGAAVLDWSRAQVSIMKPSAQSRALEAIIGDLMHTRDGATYFAERVWNASLRYDLGQNHPLAGRSVPDFELTDGTRLAALLRQGSGVLLDFDLRAPLRAVAGRMGITYLASSAKDTLGLSAVLVRPDGVVAWAADGEPDANDASRAAGRWFASTQCPNSLA
jgi:2-polyprenyl-6-methoxyphenol hydroxylase-like FAD-dependent oxidoreductase